MVDAFRTPVQAPGQTQVAGVSHPHPPAVPCVVECPPDAADPYQLDAERTLRDPEHSNPVRTAAERYPDADSGQRDAVAEQRHQKRSAPFRVDDKHPPDADSVQLDAVAEQRHQRCFVRPQMT